jgi:serine/threonine-protein kinase
VSTVEATRQTRKLGSFEILEEIGQGGMGVVYLARQTTLERAVVLKKMRRDLTLDPSMVERFQREARAAAAVHHQNVVAVYDCFAIRGDHYIAEEYVDGPDLRSVLDEVKRLPPDIAAIIGLEIIRGMEQIHATGIVHRDLKPGNVLLGRGGETKIADFGIALDGKAFGLTRPGMLMGSVPYLSPEQLLGERVDYRSDLFVFGIVLYEMLTGVPPFTESEAGARDTMLERMQAGRYVAPANRAPRTPRYLRKLIRDCLQAKPARRPTTATDVRRRLERGLGRISPADCRYRIASWLWRAELVESAHDRTQVLPVATPTAGRGGRRRPPLAPWIVPASIVGVLVGLAAIASMLGLFTEEYVRPRPEPSAVDSAGPVLDREPQSRSEAPLDLGVSVAAESAPPIEPALVRFAAWPWAEVRIEGAESFITPRAAPVPLAPGRHRIVFEHPKYGRAEYELDLAAGEERSVVHVFEEAPQP